MTQHFDSARPGIGVQKFQFDDFDSAETANQAFEEIAPDPTFTMEDMSLARLAGETSGFARGVEETHAAIEGEAAQLLQRIMTDTAALLAEQQAQRDFIGGEAVRLAMEITRKVLPAMADTGALAEVEALIARCLAERPEESRLVIRLHDSMLDPIRGKMDAMMAEAGFAAKPVLLADPALKRAEIRIEWANGGVDWSFERQLGDMEAASRRLAAKPKPKNAPKHDPEILEETDL